MIYNIISLNMRNQEMKQEKRTATTEKKTKKEKKQLLFAWHLAYLSDLNVDP